MLLKSGRLLRNAVNYNLKRYSHDGGIPGETLPFGKSIGRPGKMTALFVLYFAPGFWAPYLIFIYQYYLK